MLQESTLEFLRIPFFDLFKIDDGFCQQQGIIVHNKNAVTILRAGLENLTSSIKLYQKRAEESWTEVLQPQSVYSCKPDTTKICITL